LIGQLRDVSDTILAVDVLFHKSVIDSCIIPDGGAVRRSNDDSPAAFKQQIVELASDWITSDIGITFSTSWTACADPYFGTEHFLLSIFYTIAHFYTMIDLHFLCDGAKKRLL
jgi:hypothetical protein